MSTQAAPAPPSAMFRALARDRLGIPAVLAFILAGVAPLTVAAGVIPSAYATTGLTGIPAAFIVIAVTLALFATGYMAMARHITNAGAFYAFIARGLGRIPGTAAALVALLAYSEVVEANALTCTAQILLRAVANINEAGGHAGPRGLPVLLPGLNLIYGLPGETHRTHYENLSWLVRILDAGYLCHRINVRQARAYPGTGLSARQQVAAPPSAEHFGTWKADVSHVFDQPMKQRVYPAGMTIGGLHSFFVTARGTWHRRLGSYPIQVVEAGAVRPLFEDTGLVVTGHEPRHLYGARPDAAQPAA